MELSELNNTITSKEKLEVADLLDVSNEYVNAVLSKRRKANTQTAKDIIDVSKKIVENRLKSIQEVKKDLEKTKEPVTEQ